MAVFSTAPSFGERDCGDLLTRLHLANLPHPGTTSADNAADIGGLGSGIRNFRRYHTSALVLIWHAGCVSHKHGVRPTRSAPDQNSMSSSSSSSGSFIAASHHSTISGRAMIRSQYA